MNDRLRVFNKLDGVLLSRKLTNLVKAILVRVEDFLLASKDWFLRRRCDSVNLANGNDSQLNLLFAAKD